MLLFPEFLIGWEGSMATCRLCITGKPIRGLCKDCWRLFGDWHKRIAVPRRVHQEAIRRLGPPPIVCEPCQREQLLIDKINAYKATIEEKTEQARMEIERERELDVWGQKRALIAEEVRQHPPTEDDVAEWMAKQLLRGVRFYKKRAGRAHFPEDIR